MAENEARVALAALGRLGKGPKEQQDQLEVRAPVAGRVLKVFRESEGVVRSGAQLLEIGDPTALEIVVDVLTSEATKIRRGAPVVIDRWGGDKPLRAHVRAVEPSAFTRVSALGVDEQRVNVIVDLDEPPEVWSALGDGFQVDTQIVTLEFSGTLKVDDSAVFRNGDGWAAFEVRNGKAHLTPIELGATNSTEAQVLGGLSEGAKVVAHPSDQVSDGRSVRKR